MSARRFSRRLMAWSVVVVGVAVGALALTVLPPDALTVAARTDDPVGLVLRAGYAIEAPYAYRDAQGTLRGESVETLRAALQRAGMPEPVWVHVEFPRLVHELQRGRIDVIAAGLFITPERAGQVAFTRPTTSVHTGLLVRQGNPLGLHALEDVRHTSNGRLAVLDGSVELEQARQAAVPEAQLLRLPDPASAIAALQAGQVAAFALSVPSLRWLARMAPAPALVLAEPFATPQRNGLPDIGYPAFAFRLDDPRRTRIDQALAGYLGSAEHLQAIASQGFSADGVAAAHGMNPTRIPLDPPP
ncbi:transporter substrate-binding domain-containing protein [Sphaerotilus sp.]|uniref:transporter substrate-binding domain-containing protein n=1 Tax=Sphaerotilus sp. TaxID=2093942 RepID=UPI0025E9847B|nr:transporter substrate-binding domain-containing protein [Sphaerotilus sp.]